MKIAQLVFDAHEMSKSKGWWEDEQQTAIAESESVEIGDLLRRVGAINDAVPSAPGLRISVNCILSKLALIASEAVGESLECVRNLDFAPRLQPNGKPEGLPSELADIVIRVFDLAGSLSIDLETAIVEKMAFNATRPHRHGGRAA